MCGIIIVHCENEESNLERIIAGYNSLSNRGPDSGRMVIDDNAIVGFRRLAIIGASADGMQPFVQGETTVVCNGEIYNHKDLEREHGLSPTSGSDCECILHLYKEKGIEFTVNALSGDFAFVIVDGDTVHMARDRIGVRPLFFGFTKSGNLAVASYARAITGYCDDVRPLKPGWASYRSGTTIPEFYPYPSPSPSTMLTDAGDALSLVHDTLVTSVRSRLMSERPIGCLLSGGLDSSLVTSILCKLIGPENVRTYSVGISGSKDLFYARQVAEYLGTKHREVLFTPEEGFAAIPSVIRDLESYDITTVRASVGMWILSKWISENTDDIVILSGEGADELFCGYLYFHYAPSPEELADESQRLIDNLHRYDVLRADRCVCSHGLELRVPFLDRDMIDLCASMSPGLKAPQGGLEKHMLRSAFLDGYLPKDVLWRRKDGMSDGVSGDNGKKWYEEIQGFVESVISDEEFAASSFPTKEALYYKQMYDGFFPDYDAGAEYWMPRWIDTGGDPSGRVLPVFQGSS